MEHYIGSIMLWSAQLIPKGWLPCDGRSLDISSNKALFSLLGTLYGGDGVNNFKLPDLRGRAIRATDDLAKPREARGNEAVTLTPSSTPSHSHSFNVSSQTGNSTSFGNVVLAAAGTAPHTPTPPNIYADRQTERVALSDQSIMPTGGQPHNNMQPFLALNFIIAVVGIFPSRNEP